MKKTSVFREETTEKVAFYNLFQRHEVKLRKGELFYANAYILIYFNAGNIVQEELNFTLVEGQYSRNIDSFCTIQDGRIDLNIGEA